MAKDNVITKNNRRIKLSYKEAGINNKKKIPQLGTATVDSNGKITEVSSKINDQSKDLIYPGGFTSIDLELL